MNVFNSIYLTLSSMLAVVFQMVPGLSQKWNYRINSLYQNSEMPESEVITALYRGNINEADFYESMEKYGYDRDKAKTMFNNRQSLLDLDDLIVLYWREEIGMSEVYERGSQLGFSEEIIDLYETRNHFYPSPQDLVTWQAKEVFEPDAVRKYGLDDELENVDKEAFYKAGMDDEQIRNYWRAHWEHPSWIQMKRMLYRSDLTEDDVYEWFRLVEVPPYWRDKMIETQYKPFTRVDVRRMYELGVLDEAGTKQAYMNIGYNDEKAEAMLTFTKKYVKEGLRGNDRDLTRSMIENGYELGLLTGEELKTNLQKIGYDETEATFIKDSIDEEQYQDHLDDQIDLVEDQIMEGLIDATEASQKLGEYGLDSDRIELIINQAEERKAQDIRHPTKDDVKDWLGAGVVEESEARTWLEKMRYTGEAIDNFIAAWSGGEKREAAVGEAASEAGG